MVRHQGEAPLSSRQVEKLIELRDEAESYSTLDGFDLASLVEGCWRARLDLDEASEQFIDSLKQAGVRTLKRRQALRLIACARQLNLVEGYVRLDA